MPCVFFSVGGWCSDEQLRGAKPVEGIRRGVKARNTASVGVVRASPINMPRRTSAFKPDHARPHVARARQSRALRHRAGHNVNIAECRAWRERKKPRKGRAFIVTLLLTIDILVDH
jgi:hypothetical protein